MPKTPPTRHPDRAAGPGSDTSSHVPAQRYQSATQPLALGPYGPRAEHGQCEHDSPESGKQGDQSGVAAEGNGHRGAGGQAGDDLGRHQAGSAPREKILAHNVVPRDPARLRRRRTGKPRPSSTRRKRRHRRPARPWGLECCGKQNRANRKARREPDETRGTVRPLPCARVFPRSGPKPPRLLCASSPLACQQVLCRTKPIQANWRHQIVFTNRQVPRPVRSNPLFAREPSREYSRRDCRLCAGRRHRGLCEVTRAASSSIARASFSRCASSRLGSRV